MDAEACRGRQIVLGAELPRCESTCLCTFFDTAVVALSHSVFRLPPC